MVSIGTREIVLDRRLVNDKKLERSECSGRRSIFWRVYRKPIRIDRARESPERQWQRAMARLWPSLLDATQVVQPETVLHWHCAGFKVFWCWKSSHWAGRPGIDFGLRDLIRRMRRENPLWGASRIHGEDEVSVPTDSGQSSLGLWAQQFQDTIQFLSARQPLGTILDVVTFCDQLPASGIQRLLRRINVLQFAP